LSSVLTVFFKGYLQIKAFTRRAHKKKCVKAAIAHFAFFFVERPVDNCNAKRKPRGKKKTSSLS